MAKKTKSKTIAQRISELEAAVAGFFSGATKTSKASVKRTTKRAEAAGKRVKAAGAKRATKAKRAVKRAVKSARRSTGLT